MTSKTFANGIIRAILIISAALLFCYFIYLIQSILVYFAIAVVVSLIARPMLSFFKLKLKIPNSLAVVITMSLFILIIIGLSLMFVPLILKQSENLSLLNSEKFRSDVETLFSEINVYFLGRGIDVFDQLNKLDLLSNFKNLPQLFNSLITQIGTITVGVFSVMFISFFLMKENKIVHNTIFTLIPDSKELRVAKSITTIKELLSRYFIGLVFQITILFVIYTTILLVFGIENAVVISFLCAVLNLVPFIGPLVGGLLMFILTMTESLTTGTITQMPSTPLYVMGGYLIAQLIDNFISQPVIFSKSVKSHPLEIFLIIIIGGLLFGILGMMFAVPTYTVLKVIAKEFLADNKIVKSLTKNL